MFWATRGEGWGDKNKRRSTIGGYMRKILIIILAFGSNLFGQVFKVDLDTMGKYVLGEPIYIQHEIKNISGKEQKVSGKFRYDYILKKSNGEEVKKKNMEQYKITPCEQLEVEVIGIDWVERRSIDLMTYYYIEDAGEYIIYVRAYTRCGVGKGEGSGKIEKTWRGELRGEERKIVIKEPEGEDKEAYEYFKGNIPLSGDGAKELLTHFPTSTYAGWVLLSSIGEGGIGIPSRKDEKAVRILMENVRKIIKGKKYKEILKEKKDGLYHKGELFDEERFLKSEETKRKITEFTKNFAKANPNFSFSGYLLGTGGLNALFLGDISGGCDMLKESLKLRWDKPYITEEHKETIKEVIKIMEENGACKRE